MTTIDGLDRKLGLDLVLHTPGGETAATESLVDYLRQMFDGDVRAIVPQIAMSGGTMIACACKVILMGKQSSRGRLIRSLTAFPRMASSRNFGGHTRKSGLTRQNSRLAAHGRQILPRVYRECQKAIAWSEQLVREWLATGMLAGDAARDEKIDRIVKELTDHALTLSHARHLSAETCVEMGLNIEMLEAKQELQDAVLSIHHACMLTMSQTGAFKIIENHQGAAFIQAAQMAQMIQGIK